jgi:hypothetical protein
MADKTTQGLVVYDFEKDDIIILIHNDNDNDNDDIDGGDDEPQPLPPPNVVDPFNEDDTQGEQQEPQTIEEIIEGIQKGGLTNNNENEDRPIDEGGNKQGTDEGGDEQGTDEGGDEQGTDEGGDEQGTNEGGNEQGTDEGGNEQGTDEGGDDRGGKTAPIDEEDDNLLTEAEYIIEIERLKKAKKSLDDLLNYKGSYISEKEALQISKKIREIDQIIEKYATE